MPETSNTAATTTATPKDGPPRLAIILALTLAVTTIGAILAIAVTRNNIPDTVAIASIPAPQAHTPVCTNLLVDIGDRLGDYRRVQAVNPAPAGAAAWRLNSGDEPIILRCGLPRPTEFVVGAPIQIVNGVQWFRLDDPNITASTWISVDRPVYIALTLPSQSGPTPIQELSNLITGTIPAVAPRPNPIQLP